MIDRITIVLNDGKYLMLDFSEQNIASRTIEIFKRVTLKYNFSELTNEVNLFSVNINRFEIYCGSDIITSYFCKKKLFKLLNRKIKKKEKIGFLIYYSDNTIISPEVKYLIQKVNKDRKIDKNIYVTDCGYCSTELYKYEKEGGFVGYNAFPENVVQNEDIFLNYLKNENFINDEKWLISLVGKQSVINNNENTNE